MKAAVFHRYGGPEVVAIEEVDKPSPKPGEVLVRVRATTVAAADWRLRRADPWFVRLFLGLARPRKPAIVGMELSGVVAEVGPGVTRFEVGDAVFGLGMSGAHAEYARLKADRQVALKPANASFETAAAIAFGGLTALRYFRHADLKPGQKVLVYGASGSVGTHAVQIARHFGAHVTAVCSSGNQDLVRGLGADRVLDYAREDFADVGPIYDVIMDCVGASGFPGSLRALKRGGTYLLIAGPILPRPRALWAQLTGAANVHLWPARSHPDDLDVLRRLVEAGEITPVIERRWPFREIAEAHRLAESHRKKGHAVVVMD